MSYENIVSLTITGKEANKIQDQSDVLCVEKDTEVTGCGKSFDYRKIQKKKMKQGENDWNKEVIKVTEKENKSRNKVKVAVLDSGLCFGNDIEFVEQINLIPGEEEMSPLFVDGSGHGTSVAGIIAAEDNQEGVTGINPNIELYSAKILDDDNSAPISRVVEGIYWAIEKDVNIINISFSTPYHSQILEKAIKDAHAAGILIIAAAGNNEEVEYPAAYSEVMAVGSVDSAGEKSVASASGEELEIVAPGEKVTSTALLGGTSATSGTSLAAPHVVGVASLLWQKDLSVSADFIRALLNYSANGYGEEKDYGNGLVDYAYAEKIYNQFKVEYDKNNGLKDVSDVIDENETKRVVYEENNAVEGRWLNHDTMAAEYNANKNFQQGAKICDEHSSLYGIVDNAGFHGNGSINYVASYVYLANVAEEISSLGKTATLAQIKSKIQGVPMPKGMAEITYKSMKSKLNTYIASILQGKTKTEKKAYMYGMASHTATDVFAHASYRYTGSGWVLINHDYIYNNPNKNGSLYLMYADNPNCVQKRYKSACSILKKVISRYNGARNSIAMIRDFAIGDPQKAGNTRAHYNTSVVAYTYASLNKDATYRIYKLGNYMKEAGETSDSYLAMYYDISVN